MGFYVTTFAFGIYLGSIAVRHVLDRHHRLPRLAVNAGTA
jgi:hypothetical protein